MDKGMIDELTEGFSASEAILTAIGDPTRQRLLIEMMKMGQCRGVRVGEIAQKSHLSRPALSHHLSILKGAGIIKVRKEGTRNYYYFDPEMAGFDRLINTLLLARKIALSLPDREN